MTLGRGGRSAGILSIVLLIVGVLAGALIVGEVMRDAERPSTDGTASDPADADSTDADDATPRSSDSDADADTDTGPKEDSPTGGDPEDESDPSEADGSQLQGPAAGRMERRQLSDVTTERDRWESAHSTVIDGPVRAISETAQGLDAVAYLVAHRRWDELAPTTVETVPSVVWDSLRRAVQDAGDPLWIHAVIEAPQPEYIVRYEHERVLLRLYHIGEQVNDAEIEALPSP
ncbi:MAG: hypothetical protein ACOCYB_02470 [Alkalispirochaeta sp.]